MGTSHIRGIAADAMPAHARATNQPGKEKMSDKEQGCIGADAQQESFNLYFSNYGYCFGTW